MPTVGTVARVPSVLVIHAHPDDESFANAGRVAQLTAQGYDAVGIIATGGEAPELPQSRDMTHARSRRLEKYERALAVLGVNSWEWLERGSEWLDVPEGPLVSQADHARLQRAVGRLLDEHTPEIVLTVGADGLTGHPDHIAIYLAVREAVHDRTIPGGVWGARLAANDVRAGMRLAASFAADRRIGSGRLTGTDAQLTGFDVAAVETSRRRALDIYVDGLGTGDLRGLLGGAGRIGDGLLLRAIYDAQRWGIERYERIDAAS